jgi:hypothetical protein
MILRNHNNEDVDVDIENTRRRGVGMMAASLSMQLRESPLIIRSNRGKGFPGSLSMSPLHERLKFFTSNISMIYAFAP